MREKRCGFVKRDKKRARRIAALALCILGGALSLAGAGTAAGFGGSVAEAAKKAGQAEESATEAGQAEDAGQAKEAEKAGKTVDVKRNRHVRVAYSDQDSAIRKDANGEFVG